MQSLLDVRPKVFLKALKKEVKNDVRPKVILGVFVISLLMFVKVC